MSENQGPKRRKASAADEVLAETEPPALFLERLNDDVLIRCMVFLGIKDVRRLLLTAKHFVGLLSRLVCETAGGAARIPAALVGVQNETPLMLLAFLHGQAERSKKGQQAGLLQLAKWAWGDELHQAGPPGAPALSAFRPAGFAVGSAAPPRPAGAPAPGGTIRVANIAASEDGGTRECMLVVADDCGGVWTLRGQYLRREPLQRVLQLPHNVVRVATGGMSCAAVTSDGQVYTWGLNDHGKLGVAGGADGILPAPMQSSVPEAVVVVSLGGTHSVFVTNSGSAFTCGANAHGQLGVGDRFGRRVPTRVSATKRVQAAAAGTNFTLLRAYDGTMLAAGLVKCLSRNNPALPPAPPDRFAPVYDGLFWCSSLSAYHESFGFVGGRDGQLRVSGCGYGTSMGAAAGRHYFERPELAPTPAPVAHFQATHLRSVAVLTDGRAVFYGEHGQTTLPHGVVLEAAITSYYRAIISRVDA